MPRSGNRTVASHVGDSPVDMGLTGHTATKNTDLFHERGHALLSE
jgi:hypothetical protein